jgi:uncharacterized protein
MMVMVVLRRHGAIMTHNGCRTRQKLERVVTGPEQSALRDEASEPLRRRLLRTLDDLDKMVDTFPGKPVAGLRTDLRELRTTLLGTRPPRLVLVGRRGSGKSSLINAIFGEAVARLGHEQAQTGEATWHSHSGALGQLDFLDTRGFQEATRPTEKDESKSPLRSILAALKKRQADAVLFVVKASEVDAAMKADLKLLKSLLNKIKRRSGSVVPLVAVVTHCDLVEPKDVRLHCSDQESPEELGEKRDRIDRIEELLSEQLQDVAIVAEALMSVIGVSSYQSWNSDGILRSDQRWGIDRLCEVLYERLPGEAKLELAKVARVRSLQHKIASRCIAATASLCAGIALTPVPLADLIPITSLQVALVMSIAFVGGKRIDKSSAAEFVVAIGANVGVGFALREGTRALVKFVLPGAGSAVSSGVAFAGTWAIGRAAVAHFVDDAPMSRARALFRRGVADEK